MTDEPADRPTGEEPAVPPGATPSTPAKTPARTPAKTPAPRKGFDPANLKGGTHPGGKMVRGTRSVQSAKSRGRG